MSIALLGSGSAAARTVTVGSPLTAPFTQQRFSDPLTLVNRALPEPGANVTSPVTGVIVRWRITDASGGPFRLRVLTPAGGTALQGAGTSGPQAPSGVATQTFPVRLPIAAGQVIGVDNSNGGDLLGGAKVSGAGFGVWIPALADGATGSPFGLGAGLEVGFNADVATDRLGKLKRNTRRGTAKLLVHVPGPGRLTLRGKGVRRHRPARAASPGKVRLLIRAKGRKKKTLLNRGKVKLKVKVAYTPSGGLPGVPNTQRKKVKLVKKG